MPHEPNYRSLVPWLEGKGRNDYSQFGEDGLIEATLERIGTLNRWCFECGAADGRFYSNTLRLREEGWNAVLVERDEKQYFELAKYGSERVTTVLAEATPATFESLIGASSETPEHLDLGVIDVDGQDVHLMAAMGRFKPRVLLVEFSPYRHDRFVPEIGGEGQATLEPTIEAGQRLGYSPVAVTYCNVLFVRGDQLT